MKQSIASMLTMSITLIIALGLQKLSAQDIKIELGADQIAANQLFTITITVSNGRLESYNGFPEIKGMSKRGTSSSSSTNFVNGRISSTQSITQNYLPSGQGTITIPPFTITVNGQKITSPGKTISIGPPVQRQQQRVDPFGGDPFQDLFGRQNVPQEFIDVEAEAFLAVSTDKDEVYLGEGFTLTLAFYVAESNKAEMRFHDLGRQITDIMKEIKPANCWEENFNIDNISGEPITIGNKRYNQYKIFQAAYYPLNTGEIIIPKVGLELIKYQVAKNPTFFGQNRKEDFETFYSKPKKLKVRELPPHPLKNAVAVGNYFLDEKISSKQLQTGNSFTYSFEIKGEGNISAIPKPEIRADKNFDFYPPNIKQDITRSNGKVRGSKTFQFYGIPNEPGEYDLANYLNWVFFNTKTLKYDTLKSELKVSVVGESRKNESILASDLGSFYDIIEFNENKLNVLDDRSYMKLFANIFILLMLAATAYFIYRK